MPSWAEVLGDRAIGREELLGMTRGFKPLHRLSDSIGENMEHVRYFRVFTGEAYTPGHLPDLDEILKVVESLG